MAIQTVKTGASVNDGTGDPARTAFTKINSNFTDSANAASRLVGNADGNVPYVDQKGVNSTGVGSRMTKEFTDDQVNKPSASYGGGFYSVKTVTDTSMNAMSVIQMPYHISSYAAQIAIRQGTGAPQFLIRTTANPTSSDTYTTARVYHSLDPIIYSTTTASSPNVVVTSTGELQRSTSSERYKNIVADLTLDDVAYQNAMQLHPIVYRSTADADNSDWHYYSFSAEALGAYDKAFTLWRDTETITTEDGEVKEVPLAEPLAEGINLNALVAFLHATNVKQGQLINALTARIEALENA